MERTHPGPDLFDEPLNRIRQVAGEPSQTNAAGRDLNQFGQVRDVHQQYHFNFSGLLSEATDVSSQIPLTHPHFRTAFTELSALQNILIQSRDAAAQATIQGEQEEHLEDAQEDVNRTLKRLHELLKDWRKWDNEYRQRWLQEEGKYNLAAIAESLREDADRFVKFRQEFDSIYVLIPEYMRNRTESSVTSDDKLDNLLADRSEWEVAKKDMVRWGMSEKLLEEKKPEVVHLMQQCRDKDIGEDRLRQQAAEYEDAVDRLEGDSESLHSDEQDDYDEDVVKPSKKMDIATRDTSTVGSKTLLSSDQSLIELTEGGDHVAIKTLLGTGVNANIVDEDGKSCLHLAAISGFADIAALLIEHGALIEMKSKEGRTPLYEAAVNKRHETIKLLLGKGADTRTTGVNNNYPLHEAAHKGSVECINLLLEKDDSLINVPSSIGLTPLMLSTYTVSPRASLSLLNWGAGTDAVDDLGMTALAIAASKGNLLTVKILLRSDPAQLDRKDNDGYTPLMHAIMKQRVDVTNFLINKKADVNAKIDNRSLPSEAAYYGSIDLLEILLKLGLDVNAQDSYGYTALHWAARLGRWQNVHRLLDPRTRAVISAKSKNCWTPLHEACKNGRLKTVQILLNHGAPIMARDKWQWTPLHRAAQGGHLEVVRYLIEQNADLEARTIDDWTPLQEAINMGFTNTVKLFLDNDADTFVFDDEGFDALQKARNVKKSDIVEMIERHRANQLPYKGISNTETISPDAGEQTPETTIFSDRVETDIKVGRSNIIIHRSVAMQIMKHIMSRRVDLGIGLVALATGLAVPRSIFRFFR